MVNQKQISSGSCQWIKTAFCDLQGNSTHSENIFIKTAKCCFLLRTTANLELEIPKTAAFKGFFWQQDYFL